MRISCKQTIALLLTLVLLLTLCACAQERQTEPEKAINNAAGDVPQTKTGGRMPDKLPEEPAPAVEISLEARLAEQMLAGLSLRDAQSELVLQGEKKNAVKAAALRLKRLFTEDEA